MQVGAAVCLMVSSSAYPICLCVCLVPSEEKGRLNISVCAPYSSVDINCPCLILLKGMDNKMDWLTEQLYLHYSVKVFQELSDYLCVQICYCIILKFLLILT